MPKRFGHRLISTFKRNPRAFIGITKTHLIIHIIKVLDKYRLVAVLMPFIALALLMSVLPNKFLWAVLIGSTGYLVFAVIRKIRSKKKGR